MPIRYRFILGSCLTYMLLGSICHQATPPAPIPKLTPNSGFRWSRLADTARYSVRYVSVTFDAVPRGSSRTDVLTALADPTYSSFRLSNQQELELHKLATTPAYYSEGDCGTFQLNAGFVVYQGRQVVGKIDLGCGFNQWNYAPRNPQAKWGGLNDQGFKAMTKLLDAIYGVKRH